MIKWYRSEGRDLPWRHTRDPYAIFIAELMLQQTQVNRVIPKWYSFLTLYPNWTSLAAAPSADLIRQWVGLGYNKRIIRARKTAQIVKDRHQGLLPSKPDLLEALPGIGKYTSSAIQCFAFNKSVPVVDVNINRVLTRFYGIKTPQTDAYIRELANKALPKKNSYDWNQGLMDIGASICKANTVHCAMCPLTKSCSTSSAGTTTIISQSKISQSKYLGSNRYYRGKILNFLKLHIHNDKFGLDQLSTALRQTTKDNNMEQIKKALQGLHRDELVDLHPNAKEPTHVSLPEPL